MIPKDPDFQYGYNSDDEISSIESLASGTLLMSAKVWEQADAANRVSQSDSASYIFDLEGQIVSKTDSQGMVNYDWDARGRLDSVTLPNGQVVAYSYDALGRRKSRVESGVITNFLYDGMDVVRDAVSNGTDVHYLNGIGVDFKLRQRIGNEALFFLLDHSGTTIGLTNLLGGLVERPLFEAFGGNSNLSATRYGFTGREKDGSTGMLFYRARWMDAGQGRFITEDPLGFRGGINLYSYVSNNPISYVDPFGLAGMIKERVKEYAIDKIVKEPIVDKAKEAIPPSVHKDDIRLKTALETSLEFGVEGAIEGAVLGAAGGLGVGSAPGAIAGAFAVGQMGAGYGFIVGLTSASIFPGDDPLSEIGRDALITAVGFGLFGKKNFVELLIETGDFVVSHGPQFMDSIDLLWKSHKNTGCLKKSDGPIRKCAPGTFCISVTATATR